MLVFHVRVAGSPHMALGTAGAKVRHRSSSPVGQPPNMVNIMEYFVLGVLRFTTKYTTVSVSFLDALAQVPPIRRSTVRVGHYARNAMTCFDVGLLTNADSLGCQFEWLGLVEFPHDQSRLNSTL